MIEHKELKLMPPAPHKCKQCATEHDANEPHNQESMYWQYWFHDQHGRWPTWVDAMAHCSDDMREAWESGLAQHGITV
jgi:hypothetical protein